MNLSLTPAEVTELTQDLDPSVALSVPAAAGPSLAALTGEPVVTASSLAALGATETIKLAGSLAVPLADAAVTALMLGAIEDAVEEAHSFEVAPFDESILERIAAEDRARDTENPDKDELEFPGDEHSNDHKIEPGHGYGHAYAYAYAHALANDQEARARLTKSWEHLGNFVTGSSFVLSRERPLPGALAEFESHILAARHRLNELVSETRQMAAAMDERGRQDLALVDGLDGEVVSRMAKTREMAKTMDLNALEDDFDYQALTPEAVVGALADAGIHFKAGFCDSLRAYPGRDGEPFEFVRLVNSHGPVDPPWFDIRFKDGEIIRAHAEDVLDGIHRNDLALNMNLDMYEAG